MSFCTFSFSFIELQTYTGILPHFEIPVVIVWAMTSEKKGRKKNPITFLPQRHSPVVSRFILISSGTVNQLFRLLVCRYRFLALLFMSRLVEREQKSKKTEKAITKRLLNFRGVSTHEPWKISNRSSANLIHLFTEEMKYRIKTLRKQKKSFQVR